MSVEKCIGVRADGHPCQALGYTEGYCPVHHPDALLQNEQRIHEAYIQKAANIRAEKDREDLRSAIFAREQAEHRLRRQREEEVLERDAVIVAQLRADCQESMRLAAKLLNNPDATPEQVEHGKTLLTLVQQTRLLSKEEREQEEQKPRMMRALR
jgi:hypothetical protein